MSQATSPPIRLGYVYHALKSSWDGTIQYWWLVGTTCNIDWSVTLFYAWLDNCLTTVRYCWNKTVPLPICSDSKKQTETPKRISFDSWKHASTFSMVFKSVPIKSVLKGITAWKLHMSVTSQNWRQDLWILEIVNYRRVKNLIVSHEAIPTLKFRSRLNINTVVLGYCKLR